ncbi:TetR/AcrR family transcriptional regulator C-terminal domain-containing protein [Nonomuraea gerenzanensis]|uniref:Transcriptional regulator, GntR family / Transcriptional regulator, TetR family n=1 Tax=Nonomuraea gerenzanensis TaxID=93944 RepID=A0A1M4EBH3_9ACTN|nr:TetR/AcrR family transcriptional regulator C-terminal domain-containing protein [Nonomuraea gerenzanensis]UBU18459.1 TetR/AcrR family transcriptional regulator C-terminal domain-containing protein [Nonomuraea gerenzanensis]SBO96297.1 Transcriptional regulator, GntR family / Transcriptional regulator, TetR family [Nonomuraea gerenzanensis]
MDVFCPHEGRRRVPSRVLALLEIRKSAAWCPPTSWLGAWMWTPVAVAVAVALAGGKDRSAGEPGPADRALVKLNRVLPAPLRRLATMALYRHLEAKAELTQLIADAAFAEIDYPEPPPGWRSHLRVAAHLQWTAYQRHPWLPRLVSITRPAALPGQLAYGVWTLRALDGLGLDPVTRMHVYGTIVNYVRGRRSTSRGRRSPSWTRG